MKSKLAEIPVYKFRIFRPNYRIRTRQVDELDKEIEYADAVSSLKTDDKPQETENGESFLDAPTHYYIGDNEDVPENEEEFRRFLNAIIPRTRTLIRWMRPSIQHLYSFTDVVAALEPFFVESEDITFKQYIEIRYYIKEKIRKYVADMANTRKTYDSLKGIYRKLKTPINRIHTIFETDKEFQKYFLSTYKIGANKEIETEPDAETHTDKPIASTSSETLYRLLSMDGAEAYAAIINLHVMEHLTIPESVVGLLKPPTISSEDAKTIAVSKCDRRFITKKYKSVAELRKDDDTKDVFYDKEYDDTPYHLVDKYKDEKKRFREEEEFREFFTETLIQKHDCPPHLAVGLANTILAKKKRVNANEYAVLELKPTLADKLREDRSNNEDDTDNAKEKREVEREAENRKHIEFYRRVRDKWELDKNVTMEAFIDTNTLFCELSESCNKITDVNQCVPGEMAALQMRLSKRARMIEEFDERIARTFEEVESELRTGLVQMSKQLRRSVKLNETKLYRQNLYSYELGKYAKSTDSIIESPHIDLRERILGWSDFVAKQTMIYTFVQKYCRDPIPHMNEDPHWMYCIDTNTQLFPNSLYLLATAFLYDDYTNQLDILLRENGQLSDDGDAIVDKYTGYVLRKIDYSAEEGFDESGFRITTNAAIDESDIGAMVLDALSGKNTNNLNKVFENPTAQSAYNIFRILSENMGVQKDTAETSIEEFVLRISLEMMNVSSIVMA
jgi:hypothetical protein